MEIGFSPVSTPQRRRNPLEGHLRTTAVCTRVVRVVGVIREVVCGQVWWPILGICPLHLTHPSAHSQQWIHTRSSGQPCCGARGAVGGSVPCSRVSPQSWYWGWRERWLFTPPTDNPCQTWEANLQPLGYKSDSLTIRLRLPIATSRNSLVCPSRDLCPCYSRRRRYSGRGKARKQKTLNETQKQNGGKHANTLTGTRNRVLNFTFNKNSLQITHYALLLIFSCELSS